MSSKKGKVMKVKTLDKIGGVVFLFLTIAIIAVFLSDTSFFEWAFTRHQNTLSWYIRPLFIIPIVVGAYKKSYSLIFFSIFCLFTSMFWFSKPAIVDVKVIEFLNFEKTYFTSGWSIEKAIILATILSFFVAIISLTWSRRWYGLLATVVIGAFLKIVHSLLFSGGSGISIVKPAVLGLILCILMIYFISKRRK